jgi:hypothetical protein
MLFASSESQESTSAVPYQLLFRGWKARLAQIELSAIEAELDHLVSLTRGSEINTAHWLPFDICALGRHDWDGSPLMHIWEKACDRDRGRTCWCFAVFLWDHMMRRPDSWRFKLIDLDGAPMAGTRYYRCAVQRQQASDDMNELLAASSA